MAETINLTGRLSAPASMSAKLSAPVNMIAKLSAPINMTARLSAPINITARMKAKGFPVYNSINILGFDIKYDNEGNVSFVMGGDS